MRTSRLKSLSLLSSVLLCAALAQAQFDPAPSRQAFSPAVLTPQQLRQKVQAASKHPDHASARPALVLPPLTDTSAKFYGDDTAIGVPLNNFFLMAREPNCSLLALNVLLTTSNPISPYTIESETPNYEQVIHNAAGLTTTPDQFPSGCSDPGIGIASNTLLYVGQTPTGLRVFALADGNGGHTSVITLVTESDGSPVSLTTQPIPPDGSTPMQAVTGDVNHDGINDLISINWLQSNGTTGGASVTVYLGNADGSFTVGQTYTIPGASAQSGVLDDFNNDGKLDLVIPSGTPTTGVSQITFLPGNGDGTFGAPKTMNVNGSFTNFGSLADGLVSGDFNNDGNKDLIAGRGMVFLGNGDGTFTQLATQAFPSLFTTSGGAPMLAAGDFNKDGNLDVAMSNGTGIYIFLGNGDGTFTTGNVYANIDNVGYLTATDIDGDGNLDIFSGDATNGIFGGDAFQSNMGLALMGNGDGTFRGAPRAAAGAYGNSETAPFQTMEDLNGDGRLDYLAITYTSSFNNSGPIAAQTYLGNGDGTFTLGPALPISSFSYNGSIYTLSTVDSFVLADLNNDGHPDLVILPTASGGANTPRQGLLVAFGNADGSFQPLTFIPFPSLLIGGGLDDVLVTGLLESTRNGVPELEYSFEALQVASPNNYYMGYATQLSNGNGTLAAPAITDFYASPAPPTAILTPAFNFADVSGDKIPDLITYSNAVYNDVGVQITPPEFNLWLGNSDGTFASSQVVNVADNPWEAPLTIADVNGDGLPDLLAIGNTATGLGEIGIALNNGNGTFKAPNKILLDTAAGGESLDVAEFTGSGHADLVILGYFPPFDNGLFPGNGDGTFQTTDSGAGNGTVVPPQPINLIAYGSSIVADINGDGKPDIGGLAFLINNYSAGTTPIGSTTSLKASSTSITGGQSVTLTATVAPLSGSMVPAGTVTFLNGTTPLGSETLNSQGVATFTTSNLPVGSDSITASYSGNANFLGSSASTSITITVAGPTSQTALASSLNPSLAGEAVTITATVTSAAGTPAGTVTFRDGATTLGLRTLNPGAQAAYTSATLAVGAHSITAVYAGSTNFGASTSPVLLQTVNSSGSAGFPMLLSLSPGSATAGGAGFTLTVNGSGFTANSVVLWNGAVRTTSYVSSTQLTATVLVSDIAKESISLVTVANPSPNAATAAAQPFAVVGSEPVAKISGASLAVAANGGNHVLTLTGADFVSSSVVKWNGTALTTTYVSSWQISALVPASDYASLPATLTVTNPSGTSQPFVLH